MEKKTNKIVKPNKTHQGQTLKQDGTPDLRAGRTKRTPSRVACILEMIEKGCSPRTAALSSGMSVPAFQTWLAQDALFATAVEQAKANNEAALIAIVRSAGEKDPRLWASAKFLLETGNPEQFAKSSSSKVEVTHKVESLSHEDLLAQIDAERAKLLQLSSGQPIIDVECEALPDDEPEFPSNEPEHPTRGEASLSGDDPAPSGSIIDVGDLE